MDFGTTVSDRNITRADTDTRDSDGSRKPTGGQATNSANTVGNEIRTSDEPTSTNALPESIWQSWGKIAQANMSVRLYGDLVRLAAAHDGWRGSGSLGLRPNSLKSFLEFWSRVRDGAAEPELSLAPDGSLHAEWFDSPRKRLDVRFAEQNTYFGLFQNNNVVEGADHLNTVAEILKLHPARPLTWSTE